MGTRDLLRFIKVGLRSKWKHLTEEDIDKIISEYIHIEEVHIGCKKKPFIRHALTNDEISGSRGKNLIEWGDNNLQDAEFWSEVSKVIEKFKSKPEINILIMILHFNNTNDAALFALCWK